MRRSSARSSGREPSRDREHDPARVCSDLHELARKELLRRSRHSTVPGDEEYSFWHDLVHEVAYAQIPRARRAEAHRRTAEWIEDMAGDRVDDRVELLAHHYSTALELTRESRDGDGGATPRRLSDSLTAQLHDGRWSSIPLTRRSSRGKASRWPTRQSEPRSSTCSAPRSFSAERSRTPRVSR